MSKLFDDVVKALRRGPRYPDVQPPTLKAMGDVEYETHTGKTIPYPTSAHYNDAPSPSHAQRWPGWTFDDHMEAAQKQHNASHRNRLKAEEAERAIHGGGASLREHEALYRLRSVARAHEHASDHHIMQALVLHPQLAQKAMEPNVEKATRYHPDPEINRHFRNAIRATGGGHAGEDAGFEEGETHHIVSTSHGIYNLFHHPQRGWSAYYTPRTTFPGNHNHPDYNAGGPALKDRRFKDPHKFIGALATHASANAAEARRADKEYREEGHNTRAVVEY